MINTIQHFAYQSITRIKDLKCVLKNIDKFYYKREEVKTKDGFPQMINGIPQTRTLYPSKSTLKDIQKRIQGDIFSELIIPNYAYGSVIGRDNIANAKHHLGNKYFFTTDLKSSFQLSQTKWYLKCFCRFNFHQPFPKY